MLLHVPLLLYLRHIISKHSNKIYSLAKSRGLSLLEKYVVVHAHTSVH